MEIEAEPGKKLVEVWLGLTPKEAASLRAELEYFEQSERDPGWHAHITSGDGSCELTIYRQGSGGPDASDG